MVTWSEFENDAPDLAEAGKKLLYQSGVGLGFLAPLRKDGAPRLHPICPTVVDGRLYALIGPTPKRADLKRDGRYALHTFPAEKVDDEFLVMGRAKFIDDPAIAEKGRTTLYPLEMQTTTTQTPSQCGIEPGINPNIPAAN